MKFIDVVNFKKVELQSDLILYNFNNVRVALRNSQLMYYQLIWFSINGIPEIVEIERTLNILKALALRPVLLDSVFLFRMLIFRMHFLAYRS